MVTDDNRLLAASFGGVAGIYERTRPDYPAAAVAWLTGEHPRRVLDLAAGTGKLTRSLVAAGHDVVAVDPSEPMLVQLRAALPGVDARVGSAEAVPLADASIDVVTVAQAFHWFDPAAAPPEIARVLRPGGRLGLVWNMPDTSTPWTDELWRAINANEPRTVERPELPEPFEPMESRTFTHSQRLDRDGLLGLVSSRSYVAVLAPAERDRLLVRVGALYDRVAGTDGLTMPYVTHCFRSNRS
nr:class I SAM-dependent methyltransferase [Jiangella gansuensis]